MHPRTKRRLHMKPIVVDRRIALRYPLDDFSQRMEIVLRENDHKGERGWENCTEDYLVEKLREEMNELLTAIEEARSRRDRHRIQREAVDVANICMMIADMWR